MVEHSLKNSVLPASDSPLAIRRRKWRGTKDSLAKYSVAVGGLGVIFAIVLIFFYLLYVVVPLFYGAEIETTAEFNSADNTATHLTLNEYNDVALSLDMQGQARFFAAKSGETMLTPMLPLAESTVSSFAKGDPSTGVFAYGFENGQALVFKQAYKISYPDDIRTITPRIEYPLGESVLTLDNQGQALRFLSAQSNEEQTTLAAVTADKRLVLTGLVREESFMDEDEFTIE
ncbi:MAG: phosphate ABC transporter permease, partial [Gammaproteobacteria bacterium]|nr:phosphate ABC transporter permease [Gammaproteobacteria bacterium]